MLFASSNDTAAIQGVRLVTKYGERELYLDKTMGAALIGVVIAGCLQGVSCVQAWYYCTHQTDNWWTKSLVAATILCDTIHQGLISHTLYTYLITGFNLPEGLGLLVWSLLVEVIFNGLTALLVQCFLTARICKLSKSYLLTGVILVLVFAEFGCVLAYVSKSLCFTTFVQLSTLKTLSIAVNALGAAADVLIAGTLCLLLHFSRTGFKKSDTMINKLIMFAVNTGLLTSICAVGSLISIIVAPDTFLYIAFFFCLGRLYTNSLLATLNARSSIRNAASDCDMTSLEMAAAHHSPRYNSTLEWLHRVSGRDATQSHGNSVPGNIAIRVEMTKEYVIDNDEQSASEHRQENNLEVDIATSGISPSDQNGLSFLEL